jgi:hypothetical protein
VCDHVVTPCWEKSWWHVQTVRIVNFCSGSTRIMDGSRVGSPLAQGGEEVAL